MNDASGKRRLGWLQFSTRSMLLLMVAVATACMWYLRPETQVVDIADGALVLRQQIRTVVPNESEFAIPVRVGNWTLSDPSKRKRVAGRFSEDQYHGVWSTFHPNGQVAMRGRCRAGVPVGTWRCWFADGTQRAEFRFGKEKVTTAVERNNTLNDVTMEGLDLFVGATVLVNSSLRDGPYRLWWPNGELQIEGAYSRGKAAGTWTYYDRDGKKVAEGAYADGQRDGVWTIWNDGQAREVGYAGGREFENWNESLSQLSRWLTADDSAARLRAADQLQRFGSLALPVLQEALRNNDAGIQILAVRTLGRIGHRSQALTPDIAKVAKSTDRRLQVHARLALYRIDGAQYGSLYSVLVEYTRDKDADPRLAANILNAMYACQDDRRDELAVEILRLASTARMPARRETLASLIKNDSAVPVLRKTISHENSQIRLAAIDVLAGIAERTIFAMPIRQEVVDLIVKAEEDPDPAVQAYVKSLPSSIRTNDPPFSGSIF